MKKLTTFMLIVLFIFCNIFGAFGFEAVENDIPAPTTDIQAQTGEGAEVVEASVNQEVFSSSELGRENNEESKTSYSIQNYSGSELDLLVSNPILYVGKENEVSFQLTQNGLPVSGKTVYVDNVAYGPTNAYGKVYFNLTPTSRKLMDIVVDNVRFVSELIAINSDEGIIEVSAKDRSGNPIENFTVYADSSSLQSTVTNGGEIVRVIAKQGYNDLVFTKSGQNGSPGYYLSRSVKVTAGQFNEVTLDGTQTVAANVSFSFESNPIQNAEVFLDLAKKKWADSINRKTVGVVPSAGQHIIYVTPGKYDIFFRGHNHADELLYLGKQGVDILADYSETFNWTDTDTGILNFSTSLDSSNSFGGKQISLGNLKIDLGFQNRIRINTGTYTVKKIAITEKNNAVDYYFEKFAEKPSVSINPDSETSYSVDLTLESTGLLMNPSPIKPGTYLITQVLVNTVSLYQLTAISKGYSGLSVEVTDSKGIEDTFTDDFYISYLIPSNGPEGKYNITVNGDLGPLYGPYTISKDFEVASPRQIAVSPNVIPRNQPTDVTITVTGDNNLPVANDKVYIHQEYVGTTNSEGQLIITVERYQTTALPIRVNSLSSSLLYVIDFATEGVIEISASDIDANPIKDFEVEIYSGSSTWWRMSDREGFVRDIVKAGEAQVVFGSITYNNTSFYLSKPYKIMPGEAINRVQFDGKDSVPINLEMNYMSSPMVYASLYLKPTGFSNELFDPNFAQHYEMSVGGTNYLGKKALRVTPGTYEVGSYERYLTDLRYLKSSEMDFSSEGSFVINWDETNTGSLEVAPVTNVSDVSTDGIKINGVYFSLRNNKTIIMSLGLHLIQQISLSYNGAEYQFGTASGNGVVIHLGNAGQNYDFTPDLSRLQANLDLSDQSVTAGSVIKFDMTEPETPSGYILIKVSSINGGLINADAALKGPSGEIVATNTGPCDDGSINTNASLPAGTYTLEVTRDVGPLYEPLVTSALIKIAAESINYDVNGDGETSHPDLKEVGTSFGAKKGNPGYQIIADLNRDGVINIFDMVLLARQLPVGGSAPVPPSASGDAVITSPPPEATHINVPQEPLPSAPVIDVTVADGSLTVTNETTPTTVEIKVDTLISTSVNIITFTTESGSNSSDSP